MATIARVKQLQDHPEQAKMMIETANNRLDRLRKEGLSSSSVSYQYAKKYLQGVRKEKQGNKKEPLKFDVEDLSERNLLQVLSFTDSKSSEATLLKDSILPHAQGNFKEKLLDHYQGDNKSKRVFKEYLDSLSESQFKQLIKTYSGVIDGEYLLYDSNAMFTIIANHMVNLAQKAHENRLNNIFNQITQEGQELPGQLKEIGEALENPEKVVADKAKKMAKKKIASAIKDKIDWDALVESGQIEKDDIALYKGLISDVVNDPLHPSGSIINLGVKALKNNPEYEEAIELLPTAKALLKGNIKGTGIDLFKLVTKKGQIPSKITEAVEGSLGIDRQDEKEAHFDFGETAVKVGVDILMAGGNIFAAAPKIIKDVVGETIEFGAELVKEDTKAKNKSYKDEMKETQKNIRANLRENIPSKSKIQKIQNKIKQGKKLTKNEEELWQNMPNKNDTYEEMAAKMGLDFKDPAKKSKQQKKRDLEMADFKLALAQGKVDTTNPLISKFF